MLFFPEHCLLFSHSFLSLADLSFFSLFSSDAKAESGAEIDRQCGIAHDLVIAAVEGVFDIRIGCDAGSDGVPSSEIGADVAGGVVDVEAEEIIVRTTAYETSA